MKQYGKIIAKLRKENNMTQAELGTHLNVTYQAVSKWENDQSQPDFSTMVQIAELFHVPLTVFIDNSDKEQAGENARDGETADAPLGYCTACGNAVRKENLGRQRPTLLCSECLEEEKRRKAREEAEKKAAAEKAAKEQALAQAAFRMECRAMRNKGLIWAGVLTGVLLVLCLIVTFAGKSDIGFMLFGTLILCLFTYTFTAQLFWGGFVVDTVLFGGKIVGMPGVIFSLDLDGLIFLIGVKILFALLRLAIFLITLCIAACFAFLCSPFTFIPAMRRVLREGKTD